MKEKAIENVKQQVWKKIMSIVLNVLFYFVIIFLLFFAIANISAKSKKNIPNIFGIGMMNVLTDSMEGTKEDSFLIGDMIFVKMANESRIESLKPEESIVVCWNEGQDKIITHRLVDIVVNEKGEKIYVTQADKIEVTNPSADYDPSKGDLYLTESYDKDHILAIYSSKVGGFGNVLGFLQSSLGFGLCIVLPTAILLVIEAIILIRSILELNNQKLKKELEVTSKNGFDEEAEKERIRKELLEELRKEQENSNKDN